MEIIAILSGLVGWVIDQIKTMISTSTGKNEQEKEEMYYEKVLVPFYESCLREGKKAEDRRKFVSDLLKIHEKCIPTYIIADVEINSRKEEERIDEICKIMLVDYERSVPNRSNLIRMQSREAIFKVLSYIPYIMGAIGIYYVMNLVINLTSSINLSAANNIEDYWNRLWIQLLGLIIAFVSIIFMVMLIILILFICIQVIYKSILTLARDSFELYSNSKKSIEAKKGERLKYYDSIKDDLIWKISLDE